MARTSNLTDFLTDVSSAIKQKTGDSAPIPASEFDTEILSIETAGNYQSKTLNVTQNGNYNLLPDQEFDAISNVNISVSVSPVLQNKTITENGSYTADQNYDGLGTVIVNVPSTGIDTSDATATADDIINPTTAYTKDGKITGNIIPNYISTGIASSTIGYAVSNNNCCGIFPDGKHIVTTSGSTVLIYELLDSSNVNLIKSVSASSIGITNTSIYQIAVSYSSIEDNKYYVAFRTTGTAQTIFIAVIDLDTLIWSGGYTLPSFTANYNGGSMCFAKYTANVIAYGGRSGHDTVGAIFRLSDTSYEKITNFTLSGNKDRTGDLEFQGRDKFLVSNHTWHWDGHSSGYIKLSDKFNVLQSVNTGENNYVFYNNSNTVAILNSNGNSVQYGPYTDNSTSITLGKLTTVSITTNKCVGYLDADDEVLYVYGNNKIIAYDVNNKFSKIGECAATGYFDLGQFYRIAFNNIEGIILCSMSGSIINGIKIDKSGKQLSSLTRIGITYRNTTDATATSSDIVSGKTAYNSEGEVSGTMPNNGELNYTPTTEEQTIPAGYTSGGTIAAYPVTEEEYNTCLELTNQIIGGN